MTRPHDPRQNGAEAEEARLTAGLAAYAASDAEYTQYQEADEGDLGPPPTRAEALAALEAAGTGPAEREGRRAFGVAPALIDDMAWLWRAQSDLEGRVALAAGLWESGVHEAMLAAARMLTQARIRPDDVVWALIAGWAEGFAGAATADAACAAAGRRLLADPARLADVAGWVRSENPWARRAALIATLPFAKVNHPDAAALAARAEVLDWCVTLARDPNTHVLKAVAQWLRVLAKHDAQGVRLWIIAQPPLPKVIMRAVS